MVAQLLTHWPLVLEVQDSIPASVEENSVSKHASFNVICMDHMNTVRRPLDQDVNRRSSEQEQSSSVQVKDPYTGSIPMHVGSSC